MKRLFSFLLCFMFVSIVSYADDLVKVQVCFSKAVWSCQDGSEEITDRNVTGSNVYSHKCSDGKTTNEYELYTNCLAYPLNEYESANIKSDKASKFNKWNVDRKKPVKYVEPSKEDNLNLFNEHKKEAQRYLDKYKDKATETELQELDTSLKK